MFYIAVYQSLDVLSALLYTFFSLTLPASNRPPVVDWPHSLAILYLLRKSYHPRTGQQTPPLRYHNEGEGFSFRSQLEKSLGSSELITNHTLNLRFVFTPMSHRKSHPCPAAWLFICVSCRSLKYKKK